MLQKIFSVATMFFVLGIYCGLTWGNILFYSGGMTIISVVAIFFAKDKLFQGAVIILFLTLGIILGNVTKVDDKNNLSNIYEREVNIFGVVQTGSVRKTNQGFRLELYVQKIIVEQEEIFPANIIQVYVNGENTTNITSLDKILVRGRISQLVSVGNPSQTDYVLQQNRQNIFGNSFVKSERLTLLATNEKIIVADHLNKFLQQTFRKLETFLPIADVAMLKGLLFGGYEGINSDTVRDFSATGIIHILSVSGTHIALVGSTVFALVRICSERFAVYFASLAIIIYALLSGFVPPVVRSSMMGIIVLFAIIVEREVSKIASLSLVLLLCLLFNPRLIFDIGFQLSFVSTAGLLFLAPPLNKIMRKKLPVWLSLPIAITTAAQLAVFPFIVHYFHKISLISWVANFFVTPLIELAVLVGLLGLILFLIVTPLGTLVLIIAMSILNIANWVNSFLAKWQSMIVVVPEIAFWWCLAYYILLIVIFRLYPCQKIGDKARLKIALPIIVILCVGSFFSSPRTQTLQIHFIDVGQGDATLIITPERKSILLDSGKSDEKYDVGERIVLPYLNYYGLDSLDLLILSHSDNDHAGGAAAIARQMPIREILLPNEKIAGDLQRLVHFSPNSRFNFMQRGLKRNFGAVKLEVLYAPQGKGNDSSAVILLEYKERKILFTGDLEEAAEILLVPFLPKIDILKVAHHGSKTSSSHAFLAATRPDYAIISVGAKNRYKHPAPEVLSRLEDYQSKIFRTDWQGAIVVEIEEDLKISTYRNR